MLKIVIPGQEFWDESNEEFLYTKDVPIVLEHSLVSISKWEEKWKKPFLVKDPKSPQEARHYVECMTITQNVPTMAYHALTSTLVDTISDYINASMTATVLPPQKGPPSREIVTSELIYYWMVALQIPVEFQKWHLDRLLTLIQVCNIKNAPPSKKSKREIMDRNRALNEARRAQFNTRG